MQKSLCWLAIQREKKRRGPRGPGAREGAFRPSPCAPCPRWGGRALASAASRPPADRIRSTLGDGGLSCRVRDGIGRSPPPWPRSRRAPPARPGLPGRPGGRMASFGRRPPLETARPGNPGSGSKTRAISTARLNASRRFAAAAYRPRGLRGGPLPEGELISETASRLDAFSGYPFRAWLAGRAVGRQPGHQRPVRPGPLVLGGRPPQFSCAHGG